MERFKKIFFWIVLAFTVVTAGNALENSMYRSDNGSIANAILFLGCVYLLSKYLFGKKEGEK